MSSNTIPAPPLIFFSTHRIGGGFRMSKILKRIKAEIALKKVNGRPVRVTSMPATSSITIQPGSFCLRNRPAFSAIHMAPRIKRAMAMIAISRLILARKNAKASPSNDPKVPGATGMYPIKKPVDRNRTAFLPISMGRLYILVGYLSR